MKQIILAILLLFPTQVGAASNSPAPNSKDDPGQNSSIQQKLEPIVSELTQHIGTLEYLEMDLRSFASNNKKEGQKCQVRVVQEIIQHQLMRLWYNRLLLENIGKIRDALNLNQIATILKLSNEPVGEGIEYMNQVQSRMKPKALQGLCEKARATMEATMIAYDKAAAMLKAQNLIDCSTQ